MCPAACTEQVDCSREDPMSKSQKQLSLILLGALLFPLLHCSESQHSPDEKYYLVSANIQLPYWQSAGAGLSRAAGQLKVKAEFVGPDTYDAKLEQQEFQRVVKLKPAGILISPADPDLIKADIDAAIAQGIPVLTIDSDSKSSKRLFFIGTNNYQAGVTGGQVLVKQLQGKGNVLFFSMPGQANLDERFHGYQSVLESHPQVKMLDDLHHYPLNPLNATWAQDPYAPIPTLVDTGATLIDKSNVNEFLRSRDSATSGIR